MTQLDSKLPVRKKVTRKLWRGIIEVEDEDVPADRRAFNAFGKSVPQTRCECGCRGGLAQGRLRARAPSCDGDRGTPPRQERRSPVIIFRARFFIFDAQSLISETSGALTGQRQTPVHGAVRRGELYAVKAREALE